MEVFSYVKNLTATAAMLTDDIAAFGKKSTRMKNMSSIKKHAVMIENMTCPEKREICSRPRSR